LNFVETKDSLAILYCDFNLFSGDKDMIIQIFSMTVVFNTCYQFIRYVCFFHGIIICAKLIKTFVPFNSNLC